MPSRTASKQKLDFGEKLIQQGKGHGTDALLRRLKTLFNKLCPLDQETVDTRSLDGVKKELIHRVIMHHKDRGVKAYAACCLAELLRLYAPDAPYTADNLRDIFEFFIAQIVAGLRSSGPSGRPPPTKRGNTDSQSQATQMQQSQSQTQGGSRISEVPYYTEYCHLIESLASIKSIVIIVDLPSVDKLITDYFNGFCEIARADMSKALLRNLVSILVEVLMEAERVPQGVMDCIITQFKEHPKQPDAPAFQLIVDVCNRTSAKVLPPAVLAHFSEIQMTHGRDPSPTDLQTLKESHDLILTMFRNAPSLLLNVIPVLEENLRAVEEVPLRQLSTETLGTMFGERPLISNGVESGIVVMARAYPATWRAWLGRKVDKALPVRLAWVQATAKIITNQPDLRKEVEADLTERIQDSDERVRAAICEVVGSLNYETALHHVSKQLLLAVGGRVSDKKPHVRSEAIDAVAKLWSLAYEAIESNDEDAIEHFGWIPQEMLYATFRKDVTVDLRTQINAAFKNVILPLPAKPDDEQAWVDRFLLVTTHLDESALVGLDRMSGLKGYARGSSPYSAFAETCDEYNGGVVESDDSNVKKRLAFITDAISRMCFHDWDKARKDLDAFANAGDKRIYKLLKTMADPQSDLRAIVKSRNEFLRRIEQSHVTLLETMTVVADHAAWMLINQSSIPCLIRRLQKPEGPYAERIAAVCGRYLAFIAKECAPMYKAHVDQLVIIINDKRNDKLVEIGLQGLAAVSKSNPGSGPTDKRTIERAMKLALTGTPRQAKFASRFISLCSDNSAPQRLVDSLWDQLESGDTDNLLPTLASLAELAISASVAFQRHGEDIVKYILDVVMTRPSEDTTEDDVWVDEDELPVTDRAKLYGIKTLAHNALPWCKLPNAVQLVMPVLELLNDLVKNEGRVNDETNEGGRTRCHMRLRAAKSLLKLANVRSYDKAMSASFVNISFILQDVNFTVRNLFLKKLSIVVPPQRLLPRWNALPAFAAQDPEDENIALARSIIYACVRAARSLGQEDMKDRVEVPLARLLHLLTQHPDLEWTTLADLKNIAKFIELYVECVVTSQNVSLLFTVASKLKTVCVSGEVMDDAKLKILLDDSPFGEDEDDERHSSPTYHLYMLSELAQIIIRNRAHQQQWNLTMYPGKVRLPNDIFANLPNVSVQQSMARRSFLSEDVQAWAKTFGRKSHATGPSRRATNAATSPVKEPTARKRRRPSAKSAKKRRRTSRTDDDDEDETSDEELSEEDEDGDVVMEEEEEASEGEDEAEEQGDAVVGRGGRRSAKTKAKKAVTRKTKRAAAAVAAPKKTTRRGMSVTTQSDSDLTEMSDEE